jgi:membrane protein
MTALDLSHEIPQDRRRPFWRRKLISLVWMLATLGLDRTGQLDLFVQCQLLRFLAMESEILSPGGWRADSVGSPARAGVELVGDPHLANFLGAGRLLSAGCCIDLAPACADPKSRFGRGPSWPAYCGLGCRGGCGFTWSTLGSSTKSTGRWGAVIVLLLWVWLTSLGLLFGDQINIALYQAQKWIAERDP